MSAEDKEKTFRSYLKARSPVNLVFMQNFTDCAGNFFSIIFHVGIDSEFHALLSSLIQFSLPKNKRQKDKY